MIFVVLSSPSASWWLSEAGICMVAGIGGILVFAGLWMEGPPKQEAFSDASAFKHAKRGWNLLMLGIFVEIVVAMGFAANDGWQARQTQRQIAANDPRNLPLSSAIAYVAIEYKTDHVETNFWTPVEAHIKSNDSPSLQLFTSNGESIMLAAEPPFGFPRSPIGSGGNFKYVRRLNWDATMRELEIGSEESAAQYEKKTNSLRGDSYDFITQFIMFNPPFMNKTEVVGGKLELFLNGTVKRTLPIPPQCLV